MFSVRHSEAKWRIAQMSAECTWGSRHHQDLPRLLRGHQRPRPAVLSPLRPRVWHSDCTQTAPPAAREWRPPRLEHKPQSFAEGVPAGRERLKGLDLCTNENTTQLLVAGKHLSHLFYYDNHIVLTQLFIATPQPEYAGIRSLRRGLFATSLQGYDEKFPILLISQLN